MLSFRLLFTLAISVIASTLALAAPLDTPDIANSVIQKRSVEFIGCTDEQQWMIDLASVGP